MCVCRCRLSTTGGTPSHAPLDSQQAFSSCRGTPTYLCLAAFGNSYVAGTFRPCLLANYPLIEYT